MIRLAEFKNLLEMLQHTDHAENTEEEPNAALLLEI